jgi:hypothetical protein
VLPSFRALRRRKQKPLFSASLSRRPPSAERIGRAQEVAVRNHLRAEESGLSGLPESRKVCRIGTHLFHFAQYVNALRGWGRGLRKAVAGWYASRAADDLAHQAAKYQQREGGRCGHDLQRLHPRRSERPRHAGRGPFQLVGAARDRGLRSVLADGHQANGQRRQEVARLAEAQVSARSL